MRPIIITILIASIISGGWYWLFQEPPTHEQLYVRYNQSYPEVTEVLDHPHQQFEGGGQRAFFLYRKGEYEMAANAFERLLQKYPDNTVYLFYKGQSEMQNGEHETAIDYFNKVLAKGREQNHFYEPARWYVALCHLKNGDIEQTRSLVKEIVEDEKKYAKRAKDLQEAL